jgi:hypothetical protein
MFHAALLCENPECDASCVFKPYILDENALWCIYYYDDDKIIKKITRCP